MRILIRRWGALGDVLCVTPIAHQIRLLYPDAEIDIETAHGDVFHKNPHVTRVVPPGHAGNYDKIVDLNLAYEKRPNRHIIDAYYDEIGLNTDAPLKRRIVFGIDPPPPVGLRLTSNIVTIHAATSWSNRTLPRVFWDTVAGNLVHHGFTVMFIGAAVDYHGPQENGIQDFVSRLSIRESVNQIAASVCFIGNDSSLMHFCGATETPAVGIYTSVKAEYRMPFRHNRLGWAVAPIVPNVECYGCLERVPAPCTSLACQFGTDACVENITMTKADEVVGQTVQLRAALLASHSGPLPTPVN